MIQRGKKIQMIERLRKSRERQFEKEIKKDSERERVEILIKREIEEKERDTNESEIDKEIRKTDRETLRKSKGRQIEKDRDTKYRVRERDKIGKKV